MSVQIFLVLLCIMKHGKTALLLNVKCELGMNAIDSTSVWLLCVFHLDKQACMPIFTGEL